MKKFEVSYHSIITVLDILLCIVLFRMDMYLMACIAAWFSGFSCMGLFNTIFGEQE